MDRVVHLCPRNTLFNSKVQRIAFSQQEDYFSYETDFQFFSKIEAVALFQFYWTHKKICLLFHRTPSFSIWLLSFFFPNVRYSVCYWGDDYYLPILSVKRLSKSCVKKSPFQAWICDENERQAIIDAAANHDGFYLQNLKEHARRALMRWVSVRVASRAQTVYTTHKQYRYLRLLNRKLNRKKEFPPQGLMTRYSDPDINVPTKLRTSAEILQNLTKDEITVLVCHSASQDVNVSHTLSLLKHFSLKFGTTFNIVGYLSYSAGNDGQRDSIEETYRRQAETFAKNVTFERRFLPENELRFSLSKIDMAFFSAYRDEGVTMLSMAAQLGKVLCFNKLSVNYSYFKQLGYPGLLSHEQFLSGNLKNLEVEGCKKSQI